jgi:hypothetical protein
VTFSNQFYQHKSVAIGPQYRLRWRWPCRPGRRRSWPWQPPDGLDCEEETTPSTARAPGEELCHGRSGGTGVAGALPPAAALRARELLLVLDNVEQLVAAGPEVGALLEAFPRLTVLATGRTAGGGLFLKLTSS